MVTKQFVKEAIDDLSSVLAKILMVTKLIMLAISSLLSSVLAKILMVTKPFRYK